MDQMKLIKRQRNHPPSLNFRHISRSRPRGGGGRGGTVDPPLSFLLLFSFRAAKQVRGQSELSGCLSLVVPSTGTSNIIQEGNRGLAHHKVRQDLMRRRAPCGARRLPLVILPRFVLLLGFYTHRSVMLGEATEGFPLYLLRCYSKDLHNVSRELFFGAERKPVSGRRREVFFFFHACVGVGSATRPQCACSRFKTGTLHRFHLLPQTGSTSQPDVSNADWTTVSA